MDWKSLKIPCANESCDGELDLKKMESLRCNYRYAGRRFWTHGFRCPGCKDEVWLQRDIWFRTDYQLSPIPRWDLFGYMIAVSILAMPVGLLVWAFADYAGFVIFILGAIGAFTGWGVVTWKDMRKVQSGETTKHDNRLLFPFFATALLIPTLYFTTESESALMWSFLGGGVIAYALGSLLETERGEMKAIESEHSS
jgi:hypothetical protein